MGWGLAVGITVLLSIVTMTIVYCAQRVIRRQQAIARKALDDHRQRFGKG